MEDIKNIVIKYIKKEKKVNSSFGEILIDKASIGQGGNGIVYECKLFGSNEGSKPFAIKFLTLVGSKDKTERFISEYFNVASLPPNSFVINNIAFDKVVIEGYNVPLIIMKKYKENLVAFRKKIEEPTFDNLKKLFDFLIDSIKFIHNNGIVHRDLKPENILIDEFGNYVLADFGIAKFNPDMFSISSKTKNTRLANRIFSAPEQSESNIEAHGTMDIWAFGQILQWFVTGKTHNGINRNSISNFYQSTFANTIDQIIDRCLEHNPKRRFSSIFEIENFIEDTKFIPYYDYDSYVSLFHFGLNHTFPKGINKINHSDSKEKINSLFDEISQIRKFKDPVWKVEGSGAINLNSNQLQYELEDGKWNELDLRNENGIWLLNDFEIQFQEIWCYFNNSAYNDFLILHAAGLPRFGVYPNIEAQEEKEPVESKYLSYLDFEYAGFVDDRYYITTEEVDSGFAEIEGEVIRLSEHKLSLRRRCLKDFYVLIGSKHHTYFSPFLNRHKKIDKITTDFISYFRSNIENIEEYTNEFLNKIRKHNSLHKQYLYNIRDEY